MIDFLVTLAIGLISLSLFFSFCYGLLWLFIKRATRSEESEVPNPFRSGKGKTE